MTDEELIARLRSVHTAEDCDAAADRITALLAQRAADAERIRGHDAQRRDLEKVIRNQREELRRLQALERVHWQSVERWRGTREGLEAKIRALVVEKDATEARIAALEAQVEKLAEKTALWIEQGMVIVAPDGVPQRMALDSYRKQFAALARAAIAEESHE